MGENDLAVKQVRAALEFDTSINVHRFPVKVSVAEGAVVLEGEVESLAAKKLALEHAGSVEGLRGVVDRLRVAPAVRRGDGAIRDAFCALLMSEREFANCAIRVRDKGRFETIRDVTGDWTSTIDITVDDGIVTLEGSVISLSHKRLLGVLAWWTNGCRDVVNTVEIVPAERDSDEEVVEALSLVLEIDHLINGDQITMRCRNYVVTLDGFVRNELERRRAEFDAWALFGVDKVVNRLQMQA